ncbi:hypothetical protein [Simplicispira psychrophila]|uniref:hypothetical protein n=1 Tax=Simplicispira psychrophila TaxID=80882 RepID=UPI0012EC9DDB|nr:hypothetical protein [Simplicispira psychrophila]
MPPVTPVTPHLYEVQAVAPIALPAAPPAPAPEPTDWRELDMAYQVHHVKCPTCIAAGRGVRYGLRCGVGAALWVAYETAARNTPPPWRQPKKGRND